MPNTQLRHPTLNIHLAAILVLALVGCSGPKLSLQPTQPVDLSGRWQAIEVVGQETIQAIMEAGAGLDLPAGVGKNGQIVMKGRGRGMDVMMGGGLAFVAHDFQVLEATEITIEQGNRSMGVKHEPGVYRDVTWGKRERGAWAIYAGWENTELVILSTSSGLKVAERYSLSEPERLIVKIDMRVDGQNISIERQFHRSP